MKIIKLVLNNFKRFTDLTIDLSGLPESPKLVLLIGTNGSGKSSIFDAFELLSSFSKDGEKSKEINYYSKNIDYPYNVSIKTNQHDYTFSPHDTPYLVGQFSFYGRSSLRQIPYLSRTVLGSNKTDFEKDNDRPRRYIERDERFENDLEDIVRKIYEQAFGDTRKTMEEISQPYIKPINDAFSRIFGDNPDTQLRLKTLIPPLAGNVSDIQFEKGHSTIHYDILSSGEKEIFNILINLVSRGNLYQDSIYFLDELDVHLNTQLQKKLLKEITEYWIPDNCQLWTASHSLGFIEYANEAPRAAIIDLDDLNYDLSQTLEPQPKNDFSVFEIAVSKSFLSEIFKDKKVVFSEGNETHFYNNLKLNNTLFVNANGKNEVFYRSLTSGCLGFIDRDFLADDERHTLLKDYPHLRISDYYSFENYLFHPDNLAEYYFIKKTNFDKNTYIKALTDAKNVAETREDIIASIKGAREGYPFYKNEKEVDKLKSFRKNHDAIKAIIRSDNFDVFYKILPMKYYCKNVAERQNLRLDELCKTNYFKSKIENLI